MRFRHKSAATGGVLGLAMLAALVPAQAASATTPDSTITVGSSIRTASDSLGIGWNVPWGAVQGVAAQPGSGIWDAVNRQIKPAVLAELQKSPGAVYRYPGGNPSNNFNWMQSVGPLASRPAQYDPDSATSMKVDFGFDEFMTMVEAAGGVANITVNLNDLSNNAAAWVEYANAPNDGSNPNGGTDWAAKRAANGHPAPYNIKRWELDNEKDLLSHGGWSVSTYITKANEFIPKMRSADPTIEIYAQAVSSPWDTGRFPVPGSWKAWHQAVIQNLGSQINGIAFHPYYDGVDVPSMQGYIDAIHQDAVTLGYPNLTVSLTEHAVWPSSLSDRTTWPATTGVSGAISTTDMLLQSEQAPVVDDAFWHSLGGLSPWQPYNDVDPVTGKYTTSFAVRPLASAIEIIHDARPSGAVVLHTTTTSANTSGYSGGYDLTSSVAVSADGTELYVVISNRGSAKETALQLGTLTAAGTALDRTIIDDDPAGVRDEASTAALDGAGNLVIEVPAHSVTVYRVPLV